MQFAFADSEVAGVQVQGDMVVVRFAAAAIEAGPTGEAGYLPGVTLTFRQARWQGDPSAFRGCLVAGELSDGVSRFTRVQLPFERPGRWQAELVFAQGDRLLVEAQGVDVSRGDAPLRPSYAC